MKCQLTAKGVHVRAELVIDLNDLGLAIGRAKGQPVPVYPALTRLAEMWATFDIEVTAIHMVTTGPGTDQPRIADELFFDAWWKIESLLSADAPFAVHHLTCARKADAPNSPLGLHGLVVNTALSRSDQLVDEPDHEDMSIIVMSNEPSVANAVTYARGVPVILAGTTIPDSDFCHVRLETDPLALLAARVLSGDAPAANEIALAGVVEPSTNGRREDLGELPDDAGSVVLVDPRHFLVPTSDAEDTEDAGTWSVPERVVAAVETMGLGSGPHLVALDPDRSEADVFAMLYRFTHDHPNVSILIASNCPSVIAATADLSKYNLSNPRRVQRLCTPERSTRFDDTPYVTSHAASRVVVEQRVLDLLQRPLESQAETPEERQEATTEWRRNNKRRYVMLGAHGKEATPADSADGNFLPLTIDSCTDFALRPPALRPGLVIEAVLNERGTEWTVVSDAIERRSRRRNENLTEEEIMAMRKGGASKSPETSAVASALLKLAKTNSSAAA